MCCNKTTSLHSGHFLSASGAPVFRPHALLLRGAMYTLSRQDEKALQDFSAVVETKDLEKEVGGPSEKGREGEGRGGREGEGAVNLCCIAPCLNNLFTSFFKVHTCNCSSCVLMVCLVLEHTPRCMPTL